MKNSNEAKMFVLSGSGNRVDCHRKPGARSIILRIAHFITGIDAFDGSKLVLGMSLSNWWLTVLLQRLPGVS